MIDPLPYFRNAIKIGADRYRVACPHPDHADEHPSAVLNLRDGRWRWRCWSCGEAGDLVDVLVFSGMSLRDALAAMGYTRSLTPRSEQLLLMPIRRYASGSLGVMVCDACLVETVTVRDVAHLCELTDEGRTLGAWTLAADGAIGPACAERGADWWRQEAQATT